MKGFMKDKKFHPIRNNKSPSKERKRREFDNSKIQSLIFPKKNFSMTEAKEWASDHGYTAVKVEPTDNTWRIRQFSPNKIKFGGECRTIQFGGSGVQGVLCEVPERFKKEYTEYGTEIPESMLKNKATIDEVGHFVEKELKAVQAKKGKTISDEETFNDFWQEMGERGGAFEVLSEVGISANEAVKGTPDEGTDMVYWHIPPLVINEKTKAKIIKSRGGIAEIKEFMAYNAEWKKYQKELEAND